MTKPLDLIGRRFGKLLVLDEADRDSCNRRQWLCECDCKQRRVAIGYRLTGGQMTSCGGKVCVKRPGPPTNKRKRATKRAAQEATTEINDVSPSLRSPAFEEMFLPERKRAYARLKRQGGYWHMNPKVNGKPPPEMPADYAAGVKAIPFVRRANG